jgi:hypothetical protein
MSADVQVDEESVLARFADWRSRLVRRPLAAFGPQTREASVFVANEVLVDGGDGELVAEVVERYGGAVLDEPPLPPPAAVLERDMDLDLDALPRVVRLRFIVERHQKTSTIVTSNRDPSEWIAVMSDPLLAQSAVDRLVSTSYELVIEGDSYRRRQRPQASSPNNASH